MAKDRNTMAKRQREVQKRQKAMDKRINRTKKKSDTEPTVAASQVEVREQRLSQGEMSVLMMFRKYLMTPGKMLCLSVNDLASMKKSLDTLITAGLLVPEDFKGGYSLTRSGYEAMLEM
jgi:hypothetical protein